MSVSEAWTYHDGGHTQRPATIERDAAGSETLVISFNGTRRIPLVSNVATRGARLASGVSTVGALAAYALLERFKRHGAAYGEQAAFTVDSGRYIALFQEHPADRGVPTPHPGVTLLDAPGGGLETRAPKSASAPKSGGAVAPLLILGGLALAAALLLD